MKSKLYARLSPSTSHASGEFRLTSLRVLTRIARPLYADDPLGVQLDRRGCELSENKFTDQALGY